jgi:hypothetical protein
MEISAKFTTVTQDLLNQIPTSITDGFFKLEDADISFVVQIKFTKLIDFYKTCKRFRNIRHERTMSMFLPSNRVAPVEESGLDHLIACQLSEQAKALAGDKTYQYFRVILLFDMIFDKPQTCCCGMIGFSSYELHKLSDDMRYLIGNAISESGVTKSNHTVFLGRTTDQIVKEHGVAFLS